MAAKTRLTVFALAVLFPIIIVCVNLKAFWAASAMLMLVFSVRALKKLLIVNFASDSVYEKYMSQKQSICSEAHVLTDAILVCGAYAVIIMMLFISFYMLKASLMKGFSLILLAFWAFDFCKVFLKPSEDEDWSYKDTLKEIIMWAQSVLSIVFVAVCAFLI